jgi:hypothetical protein
MARFLSQAGTSGKPLLSHTIAITTATTTTPITAAGRCVAWGAAAFPVPEYVAMLVFADVQVFWACPSLIWETTHSLLVSGELGVVELGGVVVVGGVVVGVVTTTVGVVVGVVGVMLVVGVLEGFVVTVVGGGFGDVVVGVAVVVGGGFGVVVAVFEGEV